MALNENFQISTLSSEHALFSPSQPAWLGYDDDEYIRKLVSKYRKAIGTEIHEWVSGQIVLGHKATSLREIYKDIETHIFEKNSFTDSKTGERITSNFGRTLLFFMKYVPEETFGTIKSYINDCIAFKMETEVRVEFSENFFGTADAIRFDGKNLKVFDLKTGATPGKIEQPIIYACLYLLKYHIAVESVSVEARIYQNNDILGATPDTSELIPIMNKIIHLDNLTNEFIGGAKR